MGATKMGYLVGTGSAVNVSLGFVPDYVEVSNITDGDKITRWNRGRFIAFTSGGTTEVVAKNTLIGATSGAVALVKQVLLTTGSWAGGDAAGFFICDENDITGTIQSENMYVKGGGGTNDATVVVDVDYCHSIDTEVATETGNAAITHYAGTTAASAGFTIGSTVSEDNKILRYLAIQSD